jgi:hypothetical protein
MISHLPRLPDRFRQPWLGGPLLIVGLALMVLSLGTTLLLGVFGAVVTTFGLWLLVVAVEKRLAASNPPD